MNRPPSRQQYACCVAAWAPLLGLVLAWTLTPCPTAHAQNGQPNTELGSAYQTPRIELGPWDNGRRLLQLWDEQGQQLFARHEGQADSLRLCHTTYGPDSALQLITLTAPEPGGGGVHLRLIFDQHGRPSQLHHYLGAHHPVDPSRAHTGIHKRYHYGPQGLERVEESISCSPPPGMGPGR